MRLQFKMDQRPETFKVFKEVWEKNIKKTEKNQNKNTSSYNNKHQAP